MSRCRKNHSALSSLLLNGADSVNLFYGDYWLFSFPLFFGCCSYWFGSYLWQALPLWCTQEGGLSGPHPTVIEHWGLSVTLAFPSLHLVSCASIPSHTWSCHFPPLLTSVACKSGSEVSSRGPWTKAWSMYQVLQGVGGTFKRWGLAGHGTLHTFKQ